jgi:hypothetical protein
VVPRPRQPVPTPRASTRTARKPLQTDDTRIGAPTSRSSANRHSQAGSRAFLKIVVSPVRVRVSPLHDFAANWRFLPFRGGVAWRPFWTVFRRRGPIVAQWAPVPHALAPGGVVMGMAVLDGVLEDQRQQVDHLADRGGAEGHPASSPLVRITAPASICSRSSFDSLSRRVLTARQSLRSISSIRWSAQIGSRWHRSRQR